MQVRSQKWLLYILVPSFLQTQLVFYLSSNKSLAANKSAEQIKSTCTVDSLVQPHRLLLVAVVLRPFLYR
jgi:Na+/H+ antiporter NhaC